MSGLNIAYEISALDDFSQTFSKFDSGLRGLDKASGALKGIGAAVTGVGVGLAAGLASAIKTGAEFDAQMSKVKAISGATTEEFKAMREQALELGAKTSKSASEIASGFKEMAAMGFNANEVMKAMPGVISAAEASGSDMAQVATVMASTLNIFSKDASEASAVADILAKTANISAADITDMQYALKYAGPPAAALGVSLEELSASIGIMTNAGMEGEQAGTSLRGALLGLLSPSKQNKKLMGSLGVAIQDSQGNFVGISQLVENLSKSMSGMTETQKAATLSQLVGKEAVSGMLSLMAAGPATIDEMTASLQNSAGSSAEAAAIMKDNLAGSIDQLMGSLESLAINISDALTPAIRTVTDYLGGLVDWFNGLSDKTQTTVAIIAALTAGVALLAGPLLMLIGFLPSLIAGFSTLIPLIGALIGPVGLVIAAVVGLIAIFVALYKNNETFRDGVMAIWEQISTAFNVALTFIKELVTTIMTEVKAFIGSQLEEIRKFWDENGAAIMAVIKNAMEFVWSIISTQLNLIKGIFLAVWPIIQDVVRVAWEAIKLVISTVLDVIIGIVSVWIKILQGDWAGAWEEIKDTASNIMDNIVAFFKNIDLADIGRDIIQGLINGMKSMITAVKDTISSIANSVKDTAAKVLGIHSPSRVFMELGGYTGEGFAIGIASTVSDIQSATGSLANAAINGASSESPISAARSSIADSRAASSAGPTYVINAQYVDREALTRFAAEVSRIQGRAIGGKR